MDFTIALLLFIFTLVVYFSYTNNSQNQEKTELDELLKDARAISSSLTLSGYPTDWDNTTVIRIGVANDQSVNVTKLKSFNNLDYNNTKKKFATAYDYFIFFTNKKGDVLNVSGICGIGNPIVTTTYDASVEGTCTPINMTNANPKKLVKTERYLIYNSKVVKMVVYLWQ